MLGLTSGWDPRDKWEVSKVYGDKKKLQGMNMWKVSFLRKIRADSLGSSEAGHSIYSYEWKPYRLKDSTLSTGLQCLWPYMGISRCISHSLSGIHLVLHKLLHQFSQFIPIQQLIASCSPFLISFCGQGVWFSLSSTEVYGSTPTGSRIFFTKFCFPKISHVQK